MGIPERVLHFLEFRSSAQFQAWNSPRLGWRTSVDPRREPRTMRCMSGETFRSLCRRSRLRIHLPSETPAAAAALRTPPPLSTRCRRVLGLPKNVNSPVKITMARMKLAIGPGGHDRRPAVQLSCDGKLPERFLPRSCWRSVFGRRR